MQIIKALPRDKYARAIAHSQTDEFKYLKQAAIARLQEWYKSPYINQNIMPALWSSLGKDSMVVSILIKLAGLECMHLVINNGGDIDSHWTVYPEWEEYMLGNFSGDLFIEFYETDRPLVKIFKDHIDWGRENGLTGKDGKLVNFWNLGDLSSVIAWEGLYKFHNLYGYDDYEETGQYNVLELWGNRQGEGMEKAFEIAKKGELQFIDQDDENYVPKVRGLPIAKWKDIDVWALLASEYSPVSPIYSYHEIPQNKGAKAFPRVIAYCSPDVLSAQYFKWVCHYAPAQAKELIELFPEVPAKFKIDAK